MIQSNVALKNQHKSKTDYLILDSKKWDFQIRIILIQIKFLEQLALAYFEKEKNPKKEKCFKTAVRTGQSNKCLVLLPKKLLQKTFLLSTVSLTDLSFQL